MTRSCLLSGHYGVPSLKDSNAKESVRRAKFCQDDEGDSTEAEISELGIEGCIGVCHDGNS